MTSNAHDQDPAAILPRARFSMPDKVVVAGVAAVAAARIPEAYGADFSVRDHIPEPFDVPDHIGNLATTIGVVAALSSGYWQKRITVMPAEDVERKRKVFAFAVGAVTVLANAFAEKVGYGPTSTPDVVDFAYGLAGGLIGYRLAKPNFLNSEQLEYLETVDPDSMDANTRNTLISLQVKTGNFRGSGSQSAASTNDTKNRPSRSAAASQAKSQKNKRRRRNQKRSKR